MRPLTVRLGTLAHCAPTFVAAIVLTAVAGAAPTNGGTSSTAAWPPRPLRPRASPPPRAAPQDRPSVATPREVVDTYFGVSVSDPYRWMEEADSTEFATWLKEQDTFTRATLASLPGREAMSARAVALKKSAAARGRRVGAPVNLPGRARPSLESSARS